MKQMCMLAALAATTCLAGAALGQVKFNEALINVPGGADQGSEFFELISDSPNYAMDGLAILVIEGDSPASGLGRIDAVLNLTGKSTGANRLFLWRDTAQALVPAADAETTVYVQDFNPDIENGSNTYVLVEGFTGTVGSDIDANDDGIVDATFWTRVLDCVGYIDNGNISTTGKQYATQLGGVDITDYDPNTTTGFTPDGFARTECGWLSEDVLGAQPGPYFNDAEDTLFFPAGGSVDPSYLMTPGAPNTGIICPSSGCEADLNGDGNIDQGDVDCIIAAAAGDPSCIRTDITVNTDLNLDGNVDQGDVDAEINIVAGAPCPQ